MSAILKTFIDHMIESRPTWWVILECGHWYHWTGDGAPTEDGDFPCPSCAPPITITTVAATARPTDGNSAKSTTSDAQ